MWLLKSGKVYLVPTRYHTRLVWLLNIMRLSVLKTRNNWEQGEVKAVCLTIWASFDLFRVQNVTFARKTPNSQIPHQEKHRFRHLPPNFLSSVTAFRPVLSFFANFSRRSANFPVATFIALEKPPNRDFDRQIFRYFQIFEISPDIECEPADSVYLRFSQELLRIWASLWNDSTRSV